MKRIPFFVLFAGVATAGYGGVLLWVSAHVEGLTWLAGLITAGGILLVALWLLWFRRDTNAKDG